jgi:hypothetical protein
MTRLAQRYPQYTWNHNAGYTTRQHVIGLTAYGITPHHRKSFCRISDLLLELQHQEEIEEREQLHVLADVGIPDEDDLDDEMLDDVEVNDDAALDADDDSDSALEQRS